MTPALALSRHRDLAEEPVTCDAAQVVRHLAHELRQPLSTLESLAYYLDIVLPVTDIKARQQVEKIQQLVQQANWILDDAVHYLQASPSNPSVVALDEIITQILADRSRGRRLNLHLELGPEPCLASLDPQQAQHMLTNLLAWFRQIAQPETPINVATEAGCGESCVSLSCVAPGLTLEDLKRRFDPFSQHSPAGTGLALASAKAIVERHHGVLELDAGDGDRIRLRIRFRARL